MVNKTVALLRKFWNIFAKPTLLTIYTCFVGTHIDYDNIIYGHAFLIKLFTKTLNPYKYNAALALTGFFRGRLKEKNIKSQVWSPFNKGVGIETRFF